MITQEALFNHAYTVIKKDFVSLDEKNILSVFAKESKKFPKSLFFINLIYYKKVYPSKEKIELIVKKKIWQITIKS